MQKLQDVAESKVIDVIKLCGTCIYQIAEPLHVGDAQDWLVEQLLIFVNITANSAACSPATSSGTTRQQPPICRSEPNTRLMSCQTSSARPSRRHHVHTPHDPHTDEACTKRA